MYHRLGENFFLVENSGMSEQERGSITTVLAAASAHSGTLEKLQNDHSVQAASIEQKAHETFNQQYMVCDLELNSFSSF